MDINLIVVGKIKEDFIVNGIFEYKKRINPFCNLNIIEVKESSNEKALLEEGRLIISNIKKEDFVITLEIDGNNLSSVEFSKYIEKHYLYSSKTLTFIIGSSDGLSEDVKKRSDYKLSFSKMTFPHQLMRLIFMEQLYRAFSIINNQKYHK